jgi:16S rRNA (uracil1498-N3)-methyltransferase
MKRDWRVYHPSFIAEEGQGVRLTHEEAHHLRDVLRLGEGDRVQLFDGEGKVWFAEIVSAARDGVDVRLLESCSDSVETPIAVELFQALCRHDRMELVIQKGTELGLAAIHPFPCLRSDSRPPKPRRLERWRRIAVEAAKQSGRSIVPRIEPLERLPETGGGPLPILLMAGGAVAPLGELLAAEGPGPVWVAVGPESGFSDEEAASWISAGWRPAGLGPRVLRTETAGLAAVAIILHLWGDLGTRSG